MTPEERKQLKEVHEFMEQMKRFDRIPFNVERALSKRLDLGSTVRQDTSAVAVATFTQAVNEGGAATYDVAKIMTGFISLVDGNGNIYTVATYD